MINWQYTPGISIQKPMNVGAKIVKFGDMFYGYKIVYRLSNASVTDCDK
jgi:hypothetical protein